MTTQLDLELNAQRELVEKMFSCDLATTKENTIVMREMLTRKLAASLFITFFDIEQQDEIVFGPNWADPAIVSNYLNKAEKLMEIWENYDDAMKFLKTIRLIDTTLARRLIDRL